MSKCVESGSILGVEVADHLFLFMFLLFLPRLFVKNTKIKKNAVGKDLPKLYGDDFLAFKTQTCPKSEPPENKGAYFWS